MSQVNRLAAGGRIDRSKPMSFSFNGKTFQGFHGDTHPEGAHQGGSRDAQGLVIKFQAQLGGPPELPQL